MVLSPYVAQTVMSRLTAWLLTLALVAMFYFLLDWTVSQDAHKTIRSMQMAYYKSANATLSRSSSAGRHLTNITINNINGTKTLPPPRPKNIPTEPADAFKQRMILLSSLNNKHLRFKAQSELDDPFLPGYHDLLKIDLSKVKIYVYDIPAKFNAHYAECAMRNRRNAMCFNFDNNGFGKYYNALGGMSLYDTHQFSLEVIFHKKLLKSGMVTNNPQNATLFYVPFYAGIRCFCDRSQEYKAANDEMWNILLDKNYYLNQGKPHFMALSKVEQEMALEQCPFLNHFNSRLMKYLLIEKTYWTRTRYHLQRLGKEKELVVAPYPSFLHFKVPFVQPDVNKRKTILAFYAGSKKHSPLRNSLQIQTQKSSLGYFLPLSGECQVTYRRLATRLVSLMEQSIFCLQPPGDTPTRKGFYDAVLSGCIPVIFMDKVEYPYQKYLNYTTFTMYINEEDVVKRNESVIDILQRVPVMEIYKKQLTLQKVAKYLQYGDYAQGEDAFTFAIRSMMDAYGLTGYHT